MARYINPVPQYLKLGLPVPGGKLNFFKSGTNDLLTTFADSLLSIANPNPVILDSDGLAPSIFFNDTAKVRFDDPNDVQIWERDPVGGDDLQGEFGSWVSATIYNINDKIIASDSKFYISLVNANQGNDPTTPSPTFWSEITFIGVYNSSDTYALGEIVQNTNGSLWRSLAGANTGNTPSTSPLLWTPAIDGSKVQEIINDQTVLPKTGAVTLTALRINELRDAGPFTLPAADSIAVNQIITLDFPDRYTAFEPVVNIDTGDTITNNAGTDTSLTFKGSTRVTLTSDGVSNWSI